MPTMTRIKMLPIPIMLQSEAAITLPSITCTYIGEAAPEKPKHLNASTLTS